MKSHLNGVEVFFQDQGNAEGCPIILLHAYPMNQLMWEPQISSLSSDFRIIRYDVRGMGRSEAGPFPFAFETLVDDLLAILDHLKINQAVLCGLSMGGYIALRTVTRNPERVCGLVLCDTQSQADQNIGRLHRHEALQTIQQKGVPAFTEGFAKKVLADETLANQHEVVESLKEIVNSHSALAVSRLTLALTSRLDTTDELSKIAVPTLVIAGEHDKLIPPENTRSLQQKIPGAELAIIPKAGHMSNMENPKDFNSRVLEFMKKHFKGIWPRLLLLILLTTCGCYKWTPPTASDPLPFQNRAQTEVHEGVSVTAAIPTREEVDQIYGTDLYLKKIQPIWLQVKNNTGQPITLLTNSIDPEYYSPDETAYKTRDGYGKDPQWEREIFFQKMSLPLTLPAQSMGTGFVMTHVDKPTKYFYFDIFSEGKLRRFSFLVNIPQDTGEYVTADFDKLYPPDQVRELSLDELKTELEAMPCCAPDQPGQSKGDPINLVIVGTREKTLSALARAGWKLTKIKKESIPSIWDPALAKRPHTAKLHTPLYLFDRPEDVGFHKPRKEPNQRTQLWVWLSPWRYQGKPVWVGTVTRNIGLQYYLKKPELIITPKMDSDVDETRSYLVQDLYSAGAIQTVGWVRGTAPSTALEAKSGALGDVWYSDGLRAVLFISEQPVDIKDVEVLNWNLPPMQSTASKMIQPEDYPFKDRIVSETKGKFTVSAVVPSRQETRKIFKADLYAVGIQPVWLKIDNRSDTPISFLPGSVDPEYFSSNEAAYRSHGFYRRRSEMKRSSFFEELSLKHHVGANSSEAGFVFTHVDEGTKYFIVDLLSNDDYKRFTYLMEVPGLHVDYYKVDFDKLYKPGEIKELTLPELRRELEKFPCCTFSKKGKMIGDPVNLVIIGNQEDALSIFIRAGWRETEIKKGQVFKTLKSYLNRTPYDYAPMSNLWLFGRPQDSGFQKPRETPHERNHFRLWLTPWRYEGKQVWIGAISRDIGLRHTTKSPFLFITHKIDSDVDETREYLWQDLLEVQSIKKAGYAKGVGEVSIDHPKLNPMNDPWYSDGLRLVLFISEEPVEIGDVETLDWELPPERNAGAIQALPHESQNSVPSSPP